MGVDPNRLYVYAQAAGSPEEDGGGEGGPGGAGTPPLEGVALATLEGALRYNPGFNGADWGDACPAGGCTMPLPATPLSFRLREPLPMSMVSVADLFCAEFGLEILACGVLEVEFGIRIWNLEYGN